MTTTELRLTTVINRLLAESPPMTDASGTPVPGQTPAIECVVMLRGSGQPVRGVLSRTSEGLLRMMSPEQDEQRRRFFVEQFFDDADVVAIALRRDINIDVKGRVIIPPITPPRSS